MECWKKREESNGKDVVDELPKVFLRGNDRITSTKNRKDGKDEVNPRTQQIRGSRISENL